MSYCSVKTGPDQTSVRGYGAVISLIQQDEAATSQLILHKAISWHFRSTKSSWSSIEISKKSQRIYT